MAAMASTIPVVVKGLGPHLRVAGLSSRQILVGTRLQCARPGIFTPVLPRCIHIRAMAGQGYSSDSSPAVNGSTPFYRQASTSSTAAVSFYVAPVVHRLCSRCCTRQTVWYQVNVTWPNTKHRLHVQLQEFRHSLRCCLHLVVIPPFSYMFTWMFPCNFIEHKPLQMTKQILP